MRQVAIVQARGVQLYANIDHHVSLFNSPYYSHKVARAIDIYYNDESYEEPASSPVNGSVEMVRKVSPPHNKKFKASPSDWLIFLKSEVESHLGIRILHVEPEVEVGDKIEIGDHLGHYIRSGYFNFWTGPHMHVEVRDLANPLRAKGGYPLTPIKRGDDKEKNVNFLSGMPFFEIDLMNEDYLTVKADSWMVEINGYWGLACNVGEEIGILDGGLPHYGRCGVHLAKMKSVKKGDMVRIGSLTVGIIARSWERYATFKCTPFLICASGLSLRGLSLFLHLEEPDRFKIVPHSPGYRTQVRPNKLSDKIFLYPPKKNT